MSLNSLFSTARQGLLASMAATNATGQNIANVETPGYTRRTVGLRATPATRGGLVIRGLPSPGEGVHVGGFERVRNGVLDAAVRNGRAGMGGADQGALLLAGLEGQLAPDGGDALLGAVSGFFAAWSDVADAPTDLGTRDALLAAAGHLTQSVRGAAQRLDAFGAAATADLRGSVDRANALLAEVADLNVAIRTARSQGADDLDALDRRDQLLDDLAGLAPFKMEAKADGTVSLSIGGMMAVQGEDALPLRLSLPPDSAAPAVLATGSSTPLPLAGLESGALGAGLHVLGTALPKARAGLDALVASVVSQVNAAHAGGTGLDGSTGVAFFDPAGTTASTFALAPGLTAGAVAAGTDGPGDGSVATLLAGLGDAIGADAARLLADVGAEARRAASSSTANAALTAHAEALRAGVSSVSLDEEMANLIRFQQSYAASARVLETATQLFDTLLAL